MTNEAATQKKNPNKTSLVLRGIAVGLLLGTCISVVPICGIRRTHQLVLNEPTQSIMFIEWVLASAITCGALLPKLIAGDPRLPKFEEVKNKPKRLAMQLAKPLCAVLFLLLYFAACGLCQRLNMGVFTADSTALHTARYIGLAIATVGLTIQVMSITTALKDNATESSYNKPGIFQLRHPCFFAALVTLSGIPLVLGTWYPLFAIPGIFVALKWIITEHERALIEKNEAVYQQLQSQTRRLIPLLY
ncbi:MAG TPA: hypothetical protein V6C76_04185 [Drouetiella sp.]